MPEVLKNSDGGADWTKIFMAFAASVVLILQQFQAYRVAEIAEETKRDRVRILKEADISKKIETLEQLGKEVRGILIKQESILKRLVKVERKQGNE